MFCLVLLCGCFVFESSRAERAVSFDTELKGDGPVGIETRTAGGSELNLEESGGPIKKKTNKQEKQKKKDLLAHA